MPNTKVNVKAVIIAGILGGTVFQLWQYVYIKFQIGAASYGAIYGSFAAVPLFLVWLQISWLILLAFAEVAVQIENDYFVPLISPKMISSKAAALYITYRCLDNFTKGELPLTDRTFAQELGLSLFNIQTLLETLQNERILAIVYAEKKPIGYQPARSMNLITMKSVCDAIEKSHDIQATFQKSPEMEKIQEYLNNVDKLLENPQI